VALNSTYEQQEKGVCYEGTRRSILEDIGSWAGEQSDSEHLLWITGVPGSGKSTITATIASALKDARTLYAQFFISRTFAETTRPAVIIPTIAKQLAKNSPLAALRIHDALQDKPSLADRLSLEQAEKLFLEPIHEASKHSPMVVVVIDALDELIESKDSAIILLKVISRLPPNAKVIISSRPENDIVKSFQIPFKHIQLDTSDSILDVGTYIFARMEGIKEKVADSKDDPEWKTWPDKKQKEMLSNRAAGHFQWAETVMKFLEVRIVAKGTAGRDVILQEVGNKGMEQLDNLYTFILRNEEDDEMFCRIVGCLVVLVEPLNIGEIGLLLGIPRSELDAPLFFRRMRSVLIAGTDLVNNQTIPQMHKSFFEFITSHRAPPGFQIDTSHHHKSIVQAAFQVMKNKLKFNICHIGSSHYYNDVIPKSDIMAAIPPFLSYSCSFWGHHLKEVSAIGATCETSKDDTALPLLDVKSFMEDQFLFWLEVLSLTKQMAAAAPALETLLQWVNVSSIICGTVSINLKPLESEYQSGALSPGCQKFCDSFSECHIPKCTSYLYISPTLCTQDFKGCTALPRSLSKDIDS